MVSVENSRLLLLGLSVMRAKYAHPPVAVLKVLPSFVSMVHVWRIYLCVLLPLLALLERSLVQMALVHLLQQAVLRSALQQHLFCVWMVHASQVYLHAPNPHLSDPEPVVEVERLKRALVQ